MLIRTKLFRTKNLKHLARVHADSYQISKLILLIQKVSQRRKHISSIDHEELMFTNDWKATGSPSYVFLCMDIRPASVSYLFRRGREASLHGH